jgi:rare lipoprotein A
MRRAQRPLLLLLSLALAACETIPSSPSPGPTPGRASAPPRVVPMPADNPQLLQGPAPPGEKDFAPTPEEIPPGIENTPDAVPVLEPRSASGNSKSYEVLGRTYRVLDSSKGFRQRGYASWYGKKFHGRKTASGESYNMYKMTAAHKNLPLPSYVRVTDIDNGKSVVVKVNDRGPFHSERIIDLSFAAAAKLGLIGHGTSMVEIVAVDAKGNAPAPAPVVVASVSAVPAAPALVDASGFLQVGVYADAINAVALREDLQGHGISPVEIRVGDASGAPVHRVLVGPFRDQDEARDALNRLSLRSLPVQWVKE